MKIITSARQEIINAAKQLLTDEDNSNILDNFSNKQQKAILNLVDEMLDQQQATSEENVSGGIY